MASSNSSHRRLPGVLCGLMLGGFPAVLAAQDVRIEHVTIVSPERAHAIRDATVDIHDGRIGAISGSAASRPASGSASTPATIDGRGLYLSPGLIDSHVHLGSIPGMTEAQEAQHADMARRAREQMPRSFLLYGFTTLLDLISTPQALAQWKRHDIVPDTYFCGGAALIDGYPMNFAPKPGRYQMPYMLIEPGTEAPAGIDPKLHTPQAVVTRMKADGAICVKSFFERGFGDAHNLPVPKLETIRALVHAAHAAGLPVLLHANTSEAQAFGLEAGVDILAHGLWRWDDASSTSALTPGTRKILDQVIAGHVGWQPTIQVLAGLQDLFNESYLSSPLLARVQPSDLINWYGSAEGQWFHDVLAKDFQGANGTDRTAVAAQVDSAFGMLIERVEHATGYLAAHDARLLFGTDTPSAPTYANPPGLNAWYEMQRLLAAGETPAQIFRAATLANAQALKLDRDIGSVQVGKRANLLLLRQDPTQTIEAYATIVKVILGGRVLDPVELTANRKREAASD